MRQRIYQVDAFSSKVFRGNPAAVCPLNAWLSDEVMQAIAAENNLSETAFFFGSEGNYQLRWFTPSTEVALCGHATLAAAYVLFEELQERAPQLRFQTKSGELCVERRGERYAMRFPARIPEIVSEPPARLLEAMGRAPMSVYAADDWMLVYEREEEIAALQPDFKALKGLPLRGVIATAIGRGDADFVSRWFGPNVGVDEDPVTGSAHCTLAPYWSQRLGKSLLRAEQRSARGGELLCHYQGATTSAARGGSPDQSVELEGAAVLYMKGELYL